MKLKCRCIVTWLFGVAIFIGCSLPNAVAGFELAEDFDDLVLGPIDGQGTWNVSGTGGNVVTLPGAPVNQMLEVTVDTGVLYRELTIPNGQTRMLFMRFRYDGQHNYSFGMSGLSSPTEYSDFGPELRRTSALDLLEIHDGDRYQRLTTLAPVTWYNLWALIDNDAGNTQVWLHSRGTEEATPGDLQSAAEQTVFDFRTDFDRDLIRLYIKAADGGSGRDPFWLDDVYLETSDAVNLTNPAAPMPGDFDCDGDIDGADFLVWQRGESPLPLSAADLADWQSNFAVEPSPLAALLAIPEPSTATGVILAIAAISLRPRSRAACRLMPGD